MRKRVFTGAPWEKKVGYCRAIRAGSHVCVSGTAPVNPDGTTHAPGDAYAQMKRCLEIASNALHELGAGPEHVVRTRMFVTDVKRWPEIGRAHAEFFGDFAPVTSMVEVRALIDPEMIVEVEIDAIVGD